MGLRRAAHVAFRRVGDETVLIHLRHKRIYVLNSSGGFFWHRLDGNRDAAEMLEGVSLDAPVPEDAANGLQAFLERLREADLVETAGAGSENETALAPVPTAESKYPLPSFVPPELIWQEELRNFGQSCAFIAGSSDACNGIPTT